MLQREEPALDARQLRAAGDQRRRVRRRVALLPLAHRLDRGGDGAQLRLLFFIEAVQCHLVRAHGVAVRLRELAEMLHVVREALAVLAGRRLGVGLVPREGARKGLELGAQRVEAPSLLLLVIITLLLVLVGVRSVGSAAFRGLGAMVALGLWGLVGLCACVVVWVGAPLLALARLGLGWCRVGGG